MVLPGIQALFGFQLIAVFNDRFGQIAEIDKLIHMLALALTIVAIACLMAPASYHRQVEQNSVSESFVTYASRLIYCGMAPLMCSISLDAYVVCNVLGHEKIALLGSSLTFCLLFILWYGVPLWARNKKMLKENNRYGATAKRLKKEECV